MNRRKLGFGIAALLMAIAAFTIWQSATILGTLAGDQFCAGYPTRYWGHQLHAGPATRAEAIPKLEAAGADSVGVLCELLREHPDPEVQFLAAELLGKLGPVAHAASDDLIAATRDPDSHVRAVAAVAIPAVETPVTKALPALIPMLTSEHAGRVARAISVYRGQAKAALPDLIKLLQDETKDTETRWNAARALGKLGPEGIDALPVLIEYCTHAEETIREHAVEAIGDIGPTATAGIPALIDCLDDPATRVRRDAVRSLGYFGPAVKDTVPQIKLLLNDKEQLVRAAALNALKAIAPEEVPVPKPKEETPPTPPVDGGQEQKTKA